MCELFKLLYACGLFSLYLSVFIYLFIYSLTYLFISTLTGVGAELTDPTVIMSDDQRYSMSRL